MKKYSFPLQSVYELKEKMESREKALFQEAMTKLRQEEQALKTLEKKKASYEDKLRESITERLNIQKVKTNKEAIEILKERITNQISRVRIEERHVEVARSRMEEAMKERKTLEKLREEDFERYKKEFEKEEQKQIDELISFRHKKDAEN